MKDLLQRAFVVVKTSNIKISRRRLADYVKTLHQKADRTGLHRCQLYDDLRSSFKSIFKFIIITVLKFIFTVYCQLISLTYYKRITLTRKLRPLLKAGRVKLIYYRYYTCFKLMYEGHLSYSTATVFLAIAIC